jgi:hypothetical protein
MTEMTIVRQLVADQIEVDDAKEEIESRWVSRGIAGPSTGFHGSSPDPRSHAVFPKKYDCDLVM